MDRIMTENTQNHAGGKLTLALKDSLAAITFNSPEKLNAMSLQMWEALADVCASLATDDTLRVVTLEGAGERAFVAGADISEFSGNRNDASASANYNAAVARAETALEALSVPTIALVRGYCIGGGLAIAMRCDLRLARADARFAITPARLGLGYGYDGVAALERKLGHSVTADLLFSGRKLSADEALAKGICDQVFSADRFEEDSAAYVTRLAANAPLTIRAAKAALSDLAHPQTGKNRAAVEAMISACYDSADYREGQTAFAEKRPPRFKGR